MNLVEVHAVVTDERGNFVGISPKEDFEVYESGQLQKPSVFHLVDAEVAAPADPIASLSTLMCVKHRNGSRAGSS